MAQAKVLWREYVRVSYTVKYNWIKGKRAMVALSKDKDYIWLRKLISMWVYNTLCVNYQGNTARSQQRQSSPENIKKESLSKKITTSRHRHKRDCIYTGQAKIWCCEYVRVSYTIEYNQCNYIATLLSWGKWGGPMEWTIPVSLQKLFHSSDVLAAIVARS